MPRRARVVIPRIAHHVVQRGNYKQQVFDADKDYRTYLYLMKEYAVKFHCCIHSYCLMNNHVHFIVTPDNSRALSDLFRIVHIRYTQYKNIQKGKIGQLWQGRFFSCVLSNEHLLRAIRYVEMNPCRARLVRKPWQYLWSSTRQHVSIEQFPIIQTDFHTYCQKSGLSTRNWKEYLFEQDEEMIKTIRVRTQKSLAIGSRKFIEKLERKMGVQLSERKSGRPKKLGTKLGTDT